MRREGLATVLAAVAAAAGCGYAVGSGAARLPAGAGSVFVPPLENRTADAEADLPGMPSAEKQKGQVWACPSQNVDV